MIIYTQMNNKPTLIWYFPDQQGRGTYDTLDEMYNQIYEFGDYQ